MPPIALAETLLELDAHDQRVRAQDRAAVARTDAAWLTAAVLVRVAQSLGIDVSDLTELAAGAARSTATAAPVGRARTLDEFLAGVPAGNGPRPA